MYIHPHLDYCDIIYHIPATADQYFSSITLHPLMEYIKRIQYQYQYHYWCMERSRRLFQIHNGLTPNYLTENLPSKRRLLYGNINQNIYITKFHVTQLDIKTASSLTLLNHGTT